MAKRWASGMLVGLGLAGLLPQTATAQGYPAMAEPMPMQSAPAMAYGNPMPNGYDGGNAGFPGMPMAPTIQPGDCGPGGLPGLGLPVGMTYYPGMTKDVCPPGLAGCFHKLFYTDMGERRQVYGKIGYISLQRQSLPKTNMIALEPPFVIDFSDPFNPVERPTTDGDTIPGFPYPVIFNMNGVSPTGNPGVQFALGLQEMENCVLYEVGGFFTSNNARTGTFLAPGRLDSPYFNAPVGFQDNAGLWLNADYMQVRFVNTIYSGEANARFFGTCWKSLDINWLVGLRYIKLYERLSHYTIDDDIQYDINDPTTRATLNWKAENDLFGVQVGFGMTQRITDSWSLTWDQKFAMLANAAQTSQSLVRDDGFVGYDTAHTTWRYTQGIESGLFLEWGASSIRLRAGYEVKAFVGVATTDRNFTFDLQAAPTRHNSADTVIYHGPSASLEFIF